MGEGAAEAACGWGGGEAGRYGGQSLRLRGKFVCFVRIVSVCLAVPRGLVRTEYLA